MAKKKEETSDTAENTWLVVAQDRANRQYFKLFTDENLARDHAAAMRKKPIIGLVGLFYGENVQLPTT